MRRVASSPVFLSLRERSQQGRNRTAGLTLRVRPSHHAERDAYGGGRPGF